MHTGILETTENADSPGELKPDFIMILLTGIISPLSTCHWLITNFQTLRGRRRSRLLHMLTLLVLTGYSVDRIAAEMRGMIQECVWKS